MKTNHEPYSPLWTDRMQTYPASTYPSPMYYIHSNLMLHRIIQSLKNIPIFRLKVYKNYKCC
jgi:hypothetical protein